MIVTPAPQPLLTIHKTLIKDIAYHSGDLVGWRIDFANVGSGIAHNVVLNDFLPASLGYVSSQLYGVTPPYLFGTSMVGPNIKAEYSGFDLAPGQTGYLIITGNLLSYALCNQTLNNAFISATEIQPAIGSNALFSCYTPTANLSIVKTINKNIFALGEQILFTLTVTNNGPDTASTITIGDIWPNSACILPSTSFTSSLPVTLLSPLPAGWTYGWNLTAPLPVGQSVVLSFTGQVANNSACLGNYLNTGTLQYLVNGHTYTGNSVVPFTVGANLVTFTKTLLQGNSTPGSVVSFALDYKNTGSTPLNSYSVTDYWPGTLTFNSANPMPLTQTVVPGGLLLYWTFNSTLAPGASGRIVLTGTIK